MAKDGVFYYSIEDALKRGAMEQKKNFNPLTYGQKQEQRAINMLITENFRRGEATIIIPGSSPDSAFFNMFTREGRRAEKTLKSEESLINKRRNEVTLRLVEDRTMTKINKQGKQEVVYMKGDAPEGASVVPDDVYAKRDAIIVERREEANQINKDLIKKHHVNEHEIRNRLFEKLDEIDKKRLLNPEGIPIQHVLKDAGLKPAYPDFTKIWPIKSSEGEIYKMDYKLDIEINGKDIYRELGVFKEDGNPITDKSRTDLLDEATAQAGRMGDFAPTAAETRLRNFKAQATRGMSFYVGNTPVRLGAKAASMPMRNVDQGHKMVGDLLNKVIGIMSRGSQVR